MTICIGREFGSGGHEIAEKLAKRMGMGFYDQELVESAMERSMLSMEKLQKADERRTNPFLHDVHYNMEDRELRGLSTNDILFKVQSKIVLELAQEESVFVGRCADYILKQNNIPCISLFIAAPFEERVQRKMKLLGLDEKSASALVRKTDKERKNYYNYYTGGGWGRPHNYNICVNSSVMGIEKTVDMLAKVLTCFRS